MSIYPPLHPPGLSFGVEMALNQTVEFGDDPNLAVQRSETEAGMRLDDDDVDDVDEGALGCIHLPVDLDCPLPSARSSARRRRHSLALSGARKLHADQERYYSHRLASSFVLRLNRMLARRRTDVVLLRRVGRCRVVWTRGSEGGGECVESPEGGELVNGGSAGEAACFVDVLMQWESRRSWRKEMSQLET